jgi:DNA repair exonuclease SbcCD ATPase subunit
LRLRRVEIRGFRKLADGVCLEGLGDGLTLVSGDNEEGKSTVLAALKAALFEHYRVGGDVRDGMQAHAGGTPEVAVEFEVGGGRYALHKSFRRAGPVMLETPTGRLTDDAAEQRLIELLRFERRQGRSRPDAQHLGLQGVFWIDQGTAFAGLEALAAGRDRFAAALETEVGAVTGGDRARRLIGEVKARCRAFWTERNWLPTGELKALQGEVQALEGERDGLKRQRDEHEGRIDRLAALRQQRRRMMETDELGQARRRLKELNEQATAVAALEERAARAGSEVEARLSLWQRLDAQASSRRELGERRQALEEELGTLGRNRAVARQDLAEAERLADAAVTAETALVARLTELRAARHRAAEQVDAARLMAERGRLEADLATAREIAGALRQVKADLGLNSASRSRVEAARRAHGARVEAAAALRAVATRLQFAPDPGSAIRIGDRLLAADEPLHLVERTEIELIPFGRITVLPGGSDVGEHRQRLERADAALRAALDEIGAADLVAAEALLDERNRLEQAELAGTQELRSLLARERAETLEEIEGRHATLVRKLDQLRAASGQDRATGLEQPEEALRLAEAELETAQRQRNEASATTARLAGEASTLRVRQADAEARHEMLAAQAQGLDRQLAEEEAKLGGAALAEAVSAAATALATARRAGEELGRQLGQANPALVQDQLRLAERRCQGLEQAARDLDFEIGKLEGVLQSIGADRSVERLGEVEGELELKGLRLAQVSQEARAWRLLHDRLVEADQAARDLFLAPVRERLAPLLQEVFPEAEPVLDPATLALTHLRRGEVAEPFASLSVGAREQLAVLVRLAFAKLLLDREGESSCLILDDALVYADERRFEIMKVILERVARELQVIVLTCRPRDYVGLSARHLRLQYCRIGDSNQRV